MGAVCCKLLSCCSGHGSNLTNETDYIEDPLNLCIKNAESEYEHLEETKNESYYRSSSTCTQLPLNPLSDSSIINKLESEFEIKQKISRSDCSKIFLVKHRVTGSIFHLEQIKKAKLKTFNELVREVNLLATRVPHHPFLVNLYWTWQDEDSLYRINDATGSNIIQPSCFDDFVLFAAQLAVALHYIHSCGLVHGNVSPYSVFSSYKTKTKSNPQKKPVNKNNTKSQDDDVRDKESSNILLGCFNDLQAVECGARLHTLVGDDPKWRAPEINDNLGYFEEIDWYSYGKTLHFWMENIKDLCTTDRLKITNFINKLVEERPEDRVGYGPSAFSSIQSNLIFASIDWAPLLTFTVSKARLKMTQGSASLGASIDSLKCKSTYSYLLLDSSTTATTVEWKDYREFGWTEHEVQEGLMLENIIKNL